MSILHEVPSNGEVVEFLEEAPGIDPPYVGR